jgi:hypothetical protein
MAKPKKTPVKAMKTAAAKKPSVAAAKTAKIAAKAKAHAKGAKSAYIEAPPLTRSGSTRSMSADEADRTPDGARRRLERRDTDEACERIKAKKLCSYEPEWLNTVVGAKTFMSPHDYIGCEVRRLRPSGKNISTEFWQKFYIEFPRLVGMCCDMASEDDLVNPAAISDDVLEALSHPHHRNPKNRKPNCS